MYIYIYIFFLCILFLLDDIFYFYLHSSFDTYNMTRNFTIIPIIIFNERNNVHFYLDRTVTSLKFLHFPVNVRFY